MLAEVGGANGRSPAHPFVCIVVFCPYITLSVVCKDEYTHTGVIQRFTVWIHVSYSLDCSSRNYKDASERVMFG